MSEKSIYFALNSYMKSCFLSSRKSSVRIIVDRWLTSVQHNLKKELKNIAEVVGKKVRILIANYAIFSFQSFFKQKQKQWTQTFDFCFGAWQLYNQTYLNLFSKSFNLRFFIALNISMALFFWNSLHKYIRFTIIF